MKLRIALTMPTLLLILLAAPLRAQQEVQLSQYMFNGLAVNPALAGSHEALNAQLLCRRQWIGFSGAPFSGVGSVDGVINRSNTMGWGVLLVGESVGLMRTLGAYASYAYRLQLNQLGDRLSFGLSVGAMQESFAGVSGDDFSSRGDPLYDFGDEVILSGQTRWRPDFRVGAYYAYGKTAYAGLSASNLGSFMYADTLRKADPHIYLTGGYHYYINDSWKLSPSLFASYALFDNPIIDVNVAATYIDKFWLGVGLRMDIPLAGSAPKVSPLNALAVMAEVWVMPFLRLGYCYDYPIGRISGVQAGGHEISVGFTMARTVTSSKNPKFFK